MRTPIHFLVAGPLAAFAAALAACTSASPSASSHGCEMPLAWFHCPATFPAPGAACPPYAMDVRAGTCGSELALTYIVGASGNACWYDPASKVLVGANTGDDVPHTCDDGSSSYGWYAGRVPDSCSMADAAVVDCTGDAGTD